MANNASDLFALELTDSFIDLNGLTADMRIKVTSALRLLEQDLVAEIGRLDLDGTLTNRERRLERLLRDVRATLAKRYSQASQANLRGLREIAQAGQIQIVSAVNAVFTVNLLRPTLTLPDLKVLADKNVVLGEPSLDWWAGQQEDTRRRFVREMRLGLQRGETNAELIRRIRGKSTGRMITVKLANGRTKKIRQYSGGFMDITRRQADALVRTSAISAGNAAIKETYDQNKDIIKGYEAITTLDNRTSEICMARTGAAWFVNGDPFPESTRQEPFPGPPGWHFGCRTVLGPVTYTWEEMIERADGRKAKALNSVPDSRRAAFDGQIGTGSVKSFDDWLKQRGDPFARNKLGPGVFDLWKSGKITTSQLIDSGGKIRTLNDLRSIAS